MILVKCPYLPLHNRIFPPLDVPLQFLLLKIHVLNLPLFLPNKIIHVLILHIRILTHVRILHIHIVPHAYIHCHPLYFTNLSLFPLILFFMHLSLFPIILFSMHLSLTLFPIILFFKLLRLLLTPFHVLVHPYHVLILLIPLPTIYLLIFLFFIIPYLPLKMFLFSPENMIGDLGIRQSAL